MGVDQVGLNRVKVARFLLFTILNEDLFCWDKSIQKMAYEVVFFTPSKTELLV